MFGCRFDRKALETLDDTLTTALTTLGKSNKISKIIESSGESAHCNCQGDIIYTE